MVQVQRKLLDRMMGKFVVKGFSYGNKLIMGITNNVGSQIKINIMIPIDNNLR